MNIYNAMNTAKWALLAQQTAMEVTGQNIANVNNPNYNRQEAILEAQYPVNTGRFNIGTGVTVRTVERRFDEYIFRQTLESNYNLEKWKTRETVMSRLDILLNESGDNGISAQMSKMFGSFYNLSINPEGMAERQDIVERGLSLSQKINAVSNNLKTIRSDINSKITAAVTEVNRLSSEVARLNNLIHKTETEDGPANDFRDQRDGLLKDLSSLVDVSYFEQSNNEVVVMINNGRPLVVGQSAFTLSTRTSANDPAVNEILWADAAGGQTNILSEITGGQIGAWITLRDTDVVNSMNDVDRLAATLSRDINRLHVSGYGLDGSTGNNFFTALRGGGKGDISNTGTATIGTVSITNPEVVDLDHYKLTFDGAGNFTVFNSDLGQSSGTYTFSAGSPISFFQNRGISASITGTPAAGDIFYISGSANAGSNMYINSTLINSSAKVAAGATTNSGDSSQARRVADLQYAKTIDAAFSSAGAVNGVYAASGLFTFDDYIGSMIGAVGSSSRQAKDNRELSESISNQIFNLREQTSGVSLDEEMTNLIKYQHAYGAAAKMITTVDELLQTLLNIV